MEGKGKSRANSREHCGGGKTFGDGNHKFFKKDEQTLIFKRSILSVHARRKFFEDLFFGPRITRIFTNYFQAELAEWFW